MVDICRHVVRVDPEPVVEDPRDVSLPRVDRRFPTRLVRISGLDLDDELISDKIKSVVVEETARGLSKAVIVLLNDGLRYTDSDLFQTNVKVEVYTGYKTTPFVKRGTFYCAKPNFMFRKGSALVELICYGEEWPLTVSERRRVFENYRDSTIAEVIARDYGLESDVDATNPLHEHVAQLNSTDMQFLEERARLHGFDVYVSEGVLHFHAPRFEDSGLSLFYGSEEVSQLSSFEVCVDPWMAGQSWTRSGTDRLTGKEWSFSSEAQSDLIATTIANRNQSRFKRASEIATINGVRPERFIVGEGHEQSESEGREQVRGYTQATEWIVHGMGTIVGVETLKARQLIEIVGIGHLAGFYYVTKVLHDVSRGYRMKFEVVRPGIGSLAPALEQRSGTGTSSRSPEDASASSSIVGHAQMVP